MDSQVSELLSAFVDGEPLEASALGAALAAPGAREALIDFVRVRAALADESRPSDRFVQAMRRRLDPTRSSRLWWPVRLAAAAAVLALAVLGVADLRRRLGLGAEPDQPPPVSRVIRYEPGVDWMPIERR